jgi:hypothetical protein
VCRWAEHSYDAEQAAWEATPEGQEWLQEQERMRAEREAAAAAEDAERVRRERVWAQKHKYEWKEWKRVRLFFGFSISFGDEKPFDFDDFLKEVGRHEFPGQRVVRRNSNLPFKAGNLRWSKQQQKPVEPAGLNSQKAANFLGIRLQTLYNNRRHIPSMPGFRTLQFDRKVLEDVRNSQRFRTLRLKDQRRQRPTC